MTRIFLILTGWIALSVPVMAAEVTTFKLDNGMEIVVLEDRRAPVVVHMVWYRAGAADEPAGQSGIAHLVEHLLFKATDELESGEFSDTVARNGGSDNAFTSQDYTGYFQRVAADRLELMMKMESDRMTDIIFDPVEVNTERDVILEERNQRTENEPGALFSEQRMAAQYINHPYGLPIIGLRHEIEGLTPEMARAFYDRFYGPNNAILVVAGDVDPDEVLELAEKYYGTIPPNPNVTPRQRTVEPPQLAERRITFTDARVAQPYVLRTYLAPERNAGDQETAAALRLLADVLGGSNTTSVLSRKLQFEDTVSIYSSAFYRGQSLDETTFGLIAVPAEGVSLQEVEDALDTAVAEFIEEGVDSEQLARIKQQIRASLIYAADDVGALAQRYGAGLTQGLTVADIEAWPGILDAVTEEDIIEAAKMIFDRDKAVTGWLTGPDVSEETTQ